MILWTSSANRPSGARSRWFNPEPTEKYQMRNSLKVAATSLFLAVSLAYAAPAAFQGKWTGTAMKATAERVQVQLVIADAGSTLRLAQSEGYVTRDECLDRDLPVVVTGQTDSELTIAIKGSSVLKGCLDETATLKVIDAKTLQGTLKDGRTIKLSRK